MKLIKTIAAWCLKATFLAAIFQFTEVIALAAEGRSTWRVTYDAVMVWINFAIFAFLLVKFLKAPLINFLNGRKDELAQELNQLEEKRNRISRKINETQQFFKESETRFEDIQARIVAEGETKKTELIESAQRESRLMMEQAKVRIENQIVQARAKFKSEIVDMAISLAMERLPEVITESDQQHLLDQYVEHASAK